ncbi:MAG: helix-hairpin-helix domain-containing protein, partial [Chloroflexota bacterium]
LIAGGKGQVSHAAEVPPELGLGALPLAGIAKEREELFLPGRPDPIVLPTTSPALYLVTRLRDEAHRFAITYHRSVRARAQTRSVLDGIPGVGPARRRALLRTFGSAAGVRAATTAEIAAVDGVGPALAERIRAWLDA